MVQVVFRFVCNVEFGRTDRYGQWLFRYQRVKQVGLDEQLVAHRRGLDVIRPLSHKHRGRDTVSVLFQPGRTSSYRSCPSIPASSQNFTPSWPTHNVCTRCAVLFIAWLLGLSYARRASRDATAVRWRISFLQTANLRSRSGSLDRSTGNCGRQSVARMGLRSQSCSHCTAA